MTYEFLEDIAIADVAFRAWGTTLEAIFQSAADAFLAVSVHNPEAIATQQAQTFQLQNDELDMLLFDFIQELIYYKDTEQLLLKPQRLDLDRQGNHYHLTAEMRGEILDPNRHDQGVDVKAVTLHQFELRQTDDGWTATVILDI
jgi:SHS2 domain-containing protein